MALENAGKPPALDGSDEAVRYNLVHVFYVLTLLSAALATFGAHGILLSAGIVFFWALVFISRSRPATFRNVTVLASLLGLIWICAPSEYRTAPTPRTACHYNLFQLRIALSEYHTQYGAFPPAYVADASGKPMHSWRVLLLPFVEQEGLYQQYRFDEPWNGPHNAELAAKVPPVYQCPTHGTPAQRASGIASYFAVVGPETAWPGATSAKLSDVKGDPGIRLLLLENHELDVNWLEPRDMTDDEAVTLLSGQNTDDRGVHYADDFFAEHYYHAREAVMVNGSSYTLADGALDEGAANSLVNGTGKRTFKTNDFTADPRRYFHLRYANCFRFACFVLMVLFPLPWVWIHPTGRLPTR